MSNSSDDVKNKNKKMHSPFLLPIKVPNAVVGLAKLEESNDNESAFISCVRQELLKTLTSKITANLLKYATSSNTQPSAASTPLLLTPTATPSLDVQIREMVNLNSFQREITLAIVNEVQNSALFKKALPFHLTSDMGSKLGKKLGLTVYAILIKLGPNEKNNFKKIIFAHVQAKKIVDNFFVDYFNNHKLMMDSTAIPNPLPASSYNRLLSNKKVSSMVLLSLEGANLLPSGHLRHHSSPITNCGKLDAHIPAVLQPKKS